MRFVAVARLASHAALALSFWISVDDVDPTSGERKRIEVPSNRGGFQSWADEVYASALARELGLSILPGLATHGWLEVSGADLERIRDEATLLHTHAERLRGSNEPTLDRTAPDGTRHNVIVGGPPDEDVVVAVRDRLANIIAAADIAIALGPGRGRLSIS